MLRSISLLPSSLGFAGALYAAIVGICGAMFLRLAFRLWRSGGSDARAAHRLFIFSITYLFLLFVALLVDHGVDRLSTTMSPSGFWPSANCTPNSIRAED